MANWCFKGLLVFTPLAASYFFMHIPSTSSFIRPPLEAVSSEKRIPTASPPTPQKTTPLTQEQSSVPVIAPPRTPEKEREALAKMAASELLLKQALEKEKAFVLPELKDEDLIESDINDYYSSKTYKIKNQKINVYATENIYAETVMDEKGDALFARQYVLGELRLLTVQMDGAGGTHTFVFGGNKIPWTIQSKVGGYEFSQRFENGEIADRSYLHKNEDGYNERLQF